MGLKSFLNPAFALSRSKQHIGTWAMVRRIGAGATIATTGILKTPFLNTQFLLYLNLSEFLKEEQLFLYKILRERQSLDFKWRGDGTIAGFQAR
jgi:hypothetical protein